MSNKSTRTTSTADHSALQAAMDQRQGVEQPAGTPAPTPMPMPKGGWPRDEFSGQAGDFVRDPFTGIRSRAVPAAPAPEANTPADGQ